MMGEPPAVQGPGGVIETGAMQQHHGRLGHVKLPATAGDEGLYAVYGQMHGSSLLRNQAFCEIRSAWPRSSMISVADSMPTDSRTSSSPMPAAFSCAASIC